MDAVTIGPVWEIDESTNDYVIPEYTIGWDVVRWASTYLRQPDGPNKGKPWRFTNEQVRQVLHWYAIDEDGRFLYPSGMIQRMKGAGKDPLGAVLCVVEFIGPCRFGGWDDDGYPIAVPHSSAWVQIAAVSQTQTNNTMFLFKDLISDEAVEIYGLAIAKTKIDSASGGVLQAVTSSPKVIEGARSTFILRNETHLWQRSNAGLEMADVIRRNATKSRDGSARSLAITNAHVPGENSDAEREWDGYQAYLAGRTVHTRPYMFMDSLSAPPETDLADDESLRAGLLAARGDAVWLDIERLMVDIRDPSNPPHLSRRFYLNQVIAPDDAFLASHEWDALADPTKVVLPTDEIVMFFDGSKNDDSTALVGCRISDGHVFMLAGWDKPAGPQGADWEVDKSEVDRTVRRVLREYNVKAFFGDVLYFENYHDEWHKLASKDLVLWASDGKFKRATAWDMRGNTKPFTKAVERFEADVLEGAFTHDGDPALREHILNARRRPNRFGISIGKESRDSSRKIDRAVCAIGARMVRQQLLESGKLNQRKKRPGTLIGFNPRL